MLVRVLLAGLVAASVFGAFTGCAGDGPAVASTFQQADAGNQEEGDTPVVALPDIQVSIPDTGNPDAEAFDCSETPGAPGCPCVTSTTCDNNGYCVKSSQATDVCTTVCIEGCPGENGACVLVNFTGDPTYLCLERGINACRPCLTHTDCDDPTGLPGDKCAWYGELEGSFCGMACTSDDNCLEGYTCKEIEEAENGQPSGNITKQCVPITGACSCNERASADGAFTTCSKGQCSGSRTCAADGLTECSSPEESTEICDGADNNCNGSTDEGFVNTDGDTLADCIDPDDDEDGLIDENDNCPLTANPGQEDLDSDGVGDLCDAPEMPTVITTTPLSPKNQNSVIVLGTGEPLTLVRIFTNQFCEGAASGENYITETGDWAVPTSVPDDTTTTFWAAGVDAQGGLSECSITNTSYIEDSTPPLMPFITSSDPPTPAQQTSATLMGTTDAQAVVTVFITADCSGEPLLELQAQANGAFEAPVVVAPNATTTFYASAIDAAQNSSGCTPVGFDYRHDDISPDVPSLQSTVPPSPDKVSTSPLIVGTSEIGTTVKLYGDDLCTDGPKGLDVASGLGQFAILTLVEPNSITQFWATATDAAGNVSACTADAILFINDAEPPEPPEILDTNPVTPGNSLTPEAIGQSEPLNTVKVYSTPDCTGVVHGEGEATLDGAFAFAITVPANTTTVLYARATDLVDQDSDCSPVGFAYEHDDIAPAPPIIDKSEPGSPSPVEQLLLIGNAEPGSTVRVYLTEDCTGPSVLSLANTVDGLFATPFLTLADTVSTFYATATDIAFNTSACSDGLEYINDSTAPNPPVLTTTDPPVAGATLNPTVFGTGEPLSEIRFYLSPDCSDASVGQTDADQAGVFDQTAAVASNVVSQIFATSTDAAGNVSGCSAALAYEHDDLLPATPTLDSTTPLSPNSTSTTPTIAGTGDPDTTVTIYTADQCAGDVLATVLIGASSTFDIEAVVAENSLTTFYATATDAAGNVSGCTPDGLPYTHDTIAPDPPNLESTTPTSPSNATLLPDIGGTTEASASISVFLTADCSGPPAGFGLADNTGAFAASVGVSDNAQTLVFATATDLAGNISGCSAPIAFVHDSIPPDSVVITGMDPESPSKVLDPLVIGSTEPEAIVTAVLGADCIGDPYTLGASPASAVGGFAFTVPIFPNTKTFVSAFATDAAGNESGCSNTWGYINDSIPPNKPTLISTTPLSPSATVTEIILAGVADPGVSVNLYHGGCTGTVVATKQASFVDGTFTFATAVSINQTTTLRVAAFDEVGNQSTCSNKLKYTHDDIAPDPPSLSTTEPVTPGNVAKPLIIGTAENATIVRLYLGDSCLGAVLNQVEAVAGVWSLEPADPVAANGFTSFTATATDGAGNASGCSFALSYEHDDIAPSIPEVLSTDPLSPSPVDKPDVCGTADANVTLEVYTDPACANIIAGTVKSNGLGTYCVPLTAPLPHNATSSLFTTATDVAGNTSPCSISSADYTHDDLSPGDPLLLSFDVPTPNNAVLTPTIFGSADPDAVTVQFYTGGTPCSVLVLDDDQTNLAGDGSFFRQVTVPDNQNTAWWVTTRDAAGNQSGCSNSLSYIHDDIAPTFPEDYAGASLGTDGDSSTPTGNLEWPQAQDNFTTDDQIIYQICVSTECKAGCDPWHVDFEITDDDVDDGILNLSAIDLQPDTRYYFTVRPKDAAGNLDSNTFVATIKTSGVAQAMAIAIGDGQSCAFLSNGQLQCWGDNPVTETQTLTSVAIGGSHVCIIDAFANLQCRGANQFGQLGTGTQVGNTTFTDIMSDVRHVVTGPSHTCALKTDGTVFCWGRNINNAVGPGPEVVDTPQQIELEDGSILVGIVKLFAGGDHNCVIRGDGETLCWGFNYAGQSSSQDLFHVKYPTQVDVTDALGFIDMALGEAHTCGVSADGRVFCFGVNSDGQLGLGAAGPGAATTPTDIGLANAVAVGAGASHSCAVLADGTARCWGNNESGQLGVGLTANVVKTPTLVTTGDPAAPVTLERVVDIDASTDHGCALLADGELRCWGANTAGELGIGGAAESIVATKVTVLKGLSHLTGLARHSKHSCAVLSDGSGRCWGANDAGQVGATPTPAAPVTVLDGLSKGRVLDVQPGGSHTCALEVGGKVLCWGSNSEGQLGAIVGDTHLPVEVVLPSAAREVATGGRHSCAVLSTGDVWCWGANDRGQLGDDGNTEPAFLPSPVDGMTGPGSLAALSLIAGEDHTCAIVAGQGQFSARCWGANTWLQLGSAAGGDQNTPQPVILLTGTPVSLSAGLVHTCAVLEDGTSTCWGSNSDDQSVPAQDMSGTSLIAAGATHTCALDSVGQAYCWGDGTSGQLGLSSTISHDSPQNLLLAARGIVSGDGSSCALSHGGFAFCWGANTGDELGTGGPDPQTFAAEVQCLP